MFFLFYTLWKSVEITQKVWKNSPNTIPHRTISVCCRESFGLYQAVQQPYFYCYLYA